MDQINVPIALEGALKLKEISYIHAEGYPAGEMKHGPIALLEAKVPVIAIAMPGPVYDKVLSNAQEAKARDARMIGVLPEGHDIDFFDDVLVVGAIDELLSPMRVANINCDPVAAFIVSYCCSTRIRRGSATEFSEERDGGITQFSNFFILFLLFNRCLARLKKGSCVRRMWENL